MTPVRGRVRLVAGLDLLGFDEVSLAAYAIAAVVALLVAGWMA